MKKHANVFAALILTLLLISCKGETGATGPSGAPGTTFLAQFQNGSLPTTAYGVQDTYINEASPALSYGGCDALYVGKVSGNSRHALLLFGLTSIPAGAKVTKAFLTVTPWAIGLTATIANVYACTDYWFMGYGGCSGGTKSYSFDAAWDGPWAAPGGDRSQPLSAAVTVSGTMSTRSVTFELNKTIVQRWIDKGIVYGDAQSNLGIMLAPVDDSATVSYFTIYGSASGTNPEYRPLLSVYYTL